MQTVCVENAISALVRLEFLQLCRAVAGIYSLLTLLVNCRRSRFVYRSQIFCDTTQHGAKPMRPHNYTKSTKKNTQSYLPDPHNYSLMSQSSFRTI